MENCNEAKRYPTLWLYFILHKLRDIRSWNEDLWENQWENMENKENEVCVNNQSLSNSPGTLFLQMIWFDIFFSFFLSSTVQSLQRCLFYILGDKWDTWAANEWSLQEPRKWGKPNGRVKQEDETKITIGFFFYYCELAGNNKEQNT